MELKDMSVEELIETLPRSLYLYIQGPICSPTPHDLLNELARRLKEAEARYLSAVDGRAMMRDGLRMWKARAEKAEADAEQCAYDKVELVKEIEKLQANQAALK